MSRVLQCCEGVLLLSHRETATTRKELEMSNIKKVVSGKVNSIFVKKLIVKKGWTKQEAANFIVEFLFSGTKESFGNWMEAK